MMRHLARFFLAMALAGGMLAGEVCAEPAPETLSASPGLPPLAGPRETVLYCLRFAVPGAAGPITLDEAKAVLPWMCEHRFAMLDRSGNGVLDAADVPAFPDSTADVLHTVLTLADADAVDLARAVEMFPGLDPAAFAAMDRNRDGILAADDLPPVQLTEPRGLTLLLSAADADGNGAVTFEELAALAPGLTREVFDSIDLDKDGLITPHDLPPALADPRAAEAARLDAMDANRDGKVDVSEFRRASGGSTDDFVLLDADRDGVWALSDIAARPLPSADADRVALVRALLEANVITDGVLEYSEVARVWTDAPLALLLALDQDGNGMLERREILAALGFGIGGSRLIPEADANGDGVVNSMDIQLAVNQTLGLADIFLPADLNNDGRVNSADIQSAVRATLTRTGH
jgi:Ca2+-binding EF-hand superfamily protein